MQPAFRIRWKGVCSLCKNPVDIRMEMGIDDVKRIIPDMVTFFEHHPVNFDNNRLMWKVGGGKAYRCCEACWKRPWPVPNLRDREVTGRSRRGGIKSESLSHDTIHTWFKSLHTYIIMDPDGKYKRIPISEITHRSGLILRLPPSS